MGTLAGKHPKIFRDLITNLDVPQDFQFYATALQAMSDEKWEHPQLAMIRKALGL